MRAYRKNLFFYCVCTVVLLLPCASNYAQEGFVAPSVWVRAESDNDSIVRMVSKNENGDSVILESVIDGYMNYNPCISKNGENGFVIPYKMKRNSDLNVFVVYKPTGSSSPQTLWAIVPDSLENIHFTTRTLRKRSGRLITLADTTLPSAVISLYMDRWNGLEICDGSHVMLLGDDTTQYYGRFSEFMFFDRAIEALDLCKIYSYLVMKHSITVQGLDLIASNNDTVWRFSDNTEYSHEMAVLCRDDGYGIHQKQCGANCASSEFSIYVGNLMENNRNNEVVLENGSYLVVTNNGDSIKTTADTIYSGIGAEFYVRSRKEWKMSVIGHDFHILPVNMKLYYGDQPDSLMPRLLILRSDSLSYVTGEMEVHAPDSVDADGYYYYNNIIWDTDGDGSDRFCFATVFVDELCEKTTTQEYADADNYNDGGNATGQEGGAAGNGKGSIPSDNTYIDPSIMGLNVFPNPSYGDFIVTVDLADVQKINVRIVGVDGKTIYCNDIEGLQHYEIRKRLELPGTYIIEVSTIADKQSKAIVVY